MSPFVSYATLSELLYQGKQQFLINLMIDDDFIHGKSELIIWQFTTEKFWIEVIERYTHGMAKSK